MELMKANNIDTPDGYVATTPEEAERIFLEKFSNRNSNSDDDDPKTTTILMKAQVLSNGRENGTFVPNGFFGGIHEISSAGEAKEIASKMLHQRLVTDRAPHGIRCDKVWVVEQPSASQIRSERYVSIIMDRYSQGPLLIGCPFGSERNDGGDDDASERSPGKKRRRRSFADIALSNPQFVFTEQIDIDDGLDRDQCERMIENITGYDGNNTKTDAVAYHNFVDTIHDLYHNVFLKYDCTSIEINPLVETRDGRVLASDVSMNFDDRAVKIRHPELLKAAMTDHCNQIDDEREVEAMKHGIDYIGLSGGDIGCMVNGAGLAMATMDLIVANGGSPSNFLDVGGGASSEQISKGFEILLSKDPSCRVVLVNIFGGLLRCDVIANGIIAAIEQASNSHNSSSSHTKKPVVMRLQGTNYEKGKQIIEQYNQNKNNHRATATTGRIILANDLEDAATKAIQLGALASASAKNNKQKTKKKKTITAPTTTTTTTTTKTKTIPKFEGFSI